MLEPLEAVSESSAVARARRRGWRSLKNGGFGNARGWPDRLFFKKIFGICVYRWIEFKRRGNELTELQRRRIRELRREGAIVAVCYDADEAMMFLQAAENGSNSVDETWDL